MMYFFAPFVGWFISGSFKFLINYIRFGKEAKNKIGNGGFPSTHTTIVSSTTFLIGLNEGFRSSVFGLGVAISLIVIIDAMGLRRAVGKHAEFLNKINRERDSSSPNESSLRESMGHTNLEVVGGMLTGILVATLLNLLFKSLAYVYYAL